MGNSSLRVAAHDLDTMLDVSGKLQPTGKGAKAILSERSGKYRLLPSASEMLLLRRLDDESTTKERAIRLAGQIREPGAVCDIFALIAQLGWRGELIICDQSCQRFLYFEEGNVCGGGTSMPDERLGAVMYRYGVVTEADRASIATACAMGGRFGQMAVELGIVGQQDVYRCLRHQIEDITFATFTVSDGTFCFFDGFEASRLASHQRVPAQALLMDGVTRMDEIQFFRQKVPSDQYVPSKTSRTTEPAPKYRATYDSIDGKMSVGELGRATGRGEFEATKDVYGLERSGHVVVGAPRSVCGVLECVAAANRILEAAHAAVDDQEKAELAISLGSFAAGPGVYESLFRGAGPGVDGSFDAVILERNARRLKTDHVTSSLQKVLYEYVSFAIFCVGAAVGWQREAALSDAVAGALQVLKP